MFPSENPANNFLPKAFQANEVHWKDLAIFFPSFLGTSASKTAMGLLLTLIKSQTLTLFSVPTATHCIFGLKAIELMVEPASKDLDGWERSKMSQMRSFLSLPPVAMYFPFGEMETWLMFPSWAFKEYLI